MTVSGPGLVGGNAGRVAPSLYATAGSPLAGLIQ